MQKRILVCSDLHIPYHNPKHVELMLSVADDIGISEIILNGDTLDAFNLNAHSPKDPKVITSLEDEYQAGREFLEGLRERYPKVKITFLGGNHEFRLDRYVIKNCKHFHNILTTEKMLNLKNLKINWLEYQEKYRIEKTDLYVMHSPPSYSETAAATSLKKKLGASFIYGCSHRMDFAVRPQVDGSVVAVYMNGWLGSTNLTDEHKRIFSYTKGHECWTSSFMVVDVVGKDFFVHQVPIKKDKCIFDGVLYSM